MAKKKTEDTKETRETRKHPITAMLNEKEYSAIQRYCQKYKVKNRSKLIREMVFSSILESYEKDYPTLFDKQVMADLIVERR